jgi:hypothetical protein
MSPDQEPVDEAAATDAFFSQPEESAEAEAPPAPSPGAPEAAAPPEPTAAPPGSYVRDLQLEFEEQEDEGKV